ncbi:MAG: 6-carboxytetrahydropterin synthase [Bacteroidota bacterium]
MKVAIFRREHFNAAHKLWNSNWSEEKNEKVFGKCFNPNFHGHNYDVEVMVAGEVNPDTGYVMDVKVLSKLIRKHVTSKFDHKNLNEDTEEFKNLNPTSENIVLVIYNILRPLIDEGLDLKIRLYETERNYAEFPA